MQCGYPSFRLKCDGDTLVINLPSGDYGVRSIFYGDNSTGERTMSLFYLGVSQNNSCPLIGGRNLTLPIGSPPPLSLTHQNTNITFYYNCGFFGIPSQILQCGESISRRNHTYMFRETDFAMPSSYSKLSEGVVGMPILRRSLNTTGPLEGVIEALRNGFELRWRPALGGDCGLCEQRGGSCGLRRNKDFTCLTRSTPSSSNTRLLVSIAVPTSAAVILFVVCFLLLVIKRRSKPLTYQSHVVGFFCSV
jgi:hypothetical protein